MKTTNDIMEKTGLSRAGVFRRIEYLRKRGENIERRFGERGMFLFTDAEYDKIVNYQYEVMLK